MTCKHCGKDNRDDAAVCKYCGEALTPEQPKPKAKPKLNRAEAQAAAIHQLRQLSMILAGALVVALILGLVGLLRGCSAANAAAEATTAAAEATTAAAAAQASADQASQALSQALDRIQTLEDAAEAAPVTQPTTPPTTEDPDTDPGSTRYPATDPTTTLVAEVGSDGSVTSLAYVDATGASVPLEIGAAGLPINYVLNDVGNDVDYDSDIDLCAAVTVSVTEGYTAQVSYLWQSLTGEVWEPRPDRQEQCLTVSPGYWYSTQAQYRCEVEIEIFDSTGTACGSATIYTTSVAYSTWEAYAEAHADEHNRFLQWSDLMKTYQ